MVSVIQSKKKNSKEEIIVTKIKQMHSKRNKIRNRKTVEKKEVRAGEKYIITLKIQENKEEKM